MNEKVLTEARYNLAGFMQDRRKQLSLTQLQVAELVGISQDAIQRLEAGKYWPAMQTYFKWCAALKCFPSISEWEADYGGEALRSSVCCKKFVLIKTFVLCLHYKKL